MAKDPAFLFYPSDFLTGTMFMSNEQIGIYIRLLCSQHQHGGIINKLAFDSLVKEDQLLRSKFIETETGYYNERLTIEMDKRNKKSNNLSEAAKEVWEKRKNTIALKNDTIVLQSHNNSNAEVNKNDTIVIQTVNENEDVNKDESISVLTRVKKMNFERFWDLYQKKTGREKSLKKFMSIEIEDIDKILIHVPKYVKSKPDPQYRKDPLTYLNGKHWEDEIILPQPQNGTNNATQKPIITEPLLNRDRRNDES